MDKTINNTGVILVVILFVVLIGFAYLKANDKLPANMFTTSQPETGTEQVGTNFLANSSWVLITFNDGKSDVPLPSTPVTAVFTDSQLSGATPCNTYNSPYNLKGMSVNFPSISVSTTECDSVNAPFVQGYLSALGNVASFKIVQNVLTLYPGRGGQSLLVYTRQ